MAAWQSATGVIVRLKDRLDAADVAIRDRLDEVESLREELCEAEENLSQSNSVIKRMDAIGIHFNVGECK
jgi:hypothetical protein